MGIVLFMFMFRFSFVSDRIGTDQPCRRSVRHNAAEAGVLPNSGARPRFWLIWRWGGDTMEWTSRVREGTGPTIARQPVSAAQ